jgi:hypothetical protein
MRTTLFIMMIAILTSQWDSSTQPALPLKVMAELPGASLKWIRAAQPEIEREKLDVNKYFITVTEEDDSVSVILNSSRLSKETRGDPGPLPGFEVEISKKDMRVIKSNYIR